MAFCKVLSAACLLAAASAAPQFFQSVPQVLTHQVAQPAATVVRTAQPATFVQSAPAVSHVTHVEQPAAIVRAAPAVSHIAHVSQPATVFRSAPAVSHIAHVEQPAVVRVATPVAYEAEEVEEEISPNYNFGYSIADTRSGDAKTRQEQRDGDVVTGSYSVAQPDGRLRVVEYTASKEGGFVARVTYDGEAGPPAIPFDAPVSQVAEVAAAEPVIVNARNNAAFHSIAHVAAPAEAVHNVHTLPAAAHVVPQATVVRSAAVPVAATHAVHNVHTLPAAPATVVRSSPAVVSHAAVPAAATVVRASPFNSFSLNNGQTFIHAY